MPRYKRMMDFYTFPGGKVFYLLDKAKYSDK
jgi:hypothetical protein